MRSFALSNFSASALSISAPSIGGSDVYAPLLRNEAAHPLASRHVYLRALAMIHVSAGIAGGLDSLQQMLTCVPTVGCRPTDAFSRRMYHCEMP
jgi:hypothetical protein